LIPTSINSATSPLFTAGRTATDDVIITLGPKGQSTQTAHNIAKAGSVVNQAITNGN
jgi:hypothetical protein